MNESTKIKALHAKLPKSVWYWRITTTTRAGIPDCLYVGYERVLWIEYKLHTNPLSAPQRLIMTELARRGIQVWVIRFFGDEVLINRTPETWDLTTGELLSIAQACEVIELCTC